MGKQASRFRGAAVIGLLAVWWVPGVSAQYQGTYASSSGTGNFGLMPVPMFMGVGTSGTAAASASAMMNPMAMNYLYGPTIPMTRGQAGLLMLSTGQQMSGLGNGQLSGVRSGGRKDGNAAGTNLTAAHTRNSNIPGGQAARYFNRGVTTAARSEPHFKRQTRYFPHK